ncbi:hypothetical protein VCUG_01695 [Vavraia culicis subsp. floridensis]|uniref:U3 small nucleolar RNA-associated protein 15 C-terminal domain-containing protein n=1 Tax=Vavraia culicis (isolate floridensis) TaxID=948595 RepID=L2GUL8_VAVCU|nr:uncharacterized protein VCUG_01695 [Vavraia culicis subsp. floridensis]ELA46795.1 hypothetical protein VCUG_01695 [Vavraia culicis subsp. floridensis]
MFISPYTHSKSQPFSHFSYSSTNLFTSFSSSLHAHAPNARILTKFPNEITAIHANRLGVAADQSGNIKLFSDTHVLKQFNYHRARVNVVRVCEGRCVVSCSDDGSVVWNELESVRVFDWHNDYVRAVCVDGNVVVSGALDGQMVVHDLRESKSMNRYTAAEPVMHLESTDGVVYIATPTGITHFSLKEQKAVHHTINYGINDLKVSNGLLYACTAHSLTVYSSNLEEVFFCRLRDESVGMACKDGEVMIGLKNGTILGLRAHCDSGKTVDRDEAIKGRVVGEEAHGHTTSDEMNDQVIDEIVYDQITRGDSKEYEQGDGVDSKKMQNVAEKHRNGCKELKETLNSTVNGAVPSSSLHYKENEHPIHILSKPFMVYDRYERMLRNHEYRKCLKAVLTANDKHRMYRVLRYIHNKGVLRQAIYRHNVRLLTNYLSEFIGDLLHKSIALKGLVIISGVFDRMLLQDKEMLRRVRYAIKNEERVQKECVKTYAYLETLLESVNEEQ